MICFVFCFVVVFVGFVFLFIFVFCVVVLIFCLIIIEVYGFDVGGVVEVVLFVFVFVIVDEEGVFILIDFDIEEWEEFVFFGDVIVVFGDGCLIYWVFVDDVGVEVIDIVCWIVLYGDYIYLFCGDVWLWGMFDGIGDVCVIVGG